MTTVRWVDHLLKNLTRWLGMARRKQCPFGGSGEVQDMQQHDDPSFTIERRPSREVPRP